MSDADSKSEENPEELSNKEGEEKEAEELEDKPEDFQEKN